MGVSKNKVWIPFKPGGGQIIFNLVTSKTAPRPEVPIVSRGFGSPSAPDSELVHKGTWDDLFPIISGRGKWSGCNFFFKKNGVGINADTKFELESRI